MLLSRPVDGESVMETIKVGGKNGPFTCGNNRGPNVWLGRRNNNIVRSWRFGRRGRSGNAADDGWAADRGRAASRCRETPRPSRPRSVKNAKLNLEIGGRASSVSRVANDRSAVGRRSRDQLHEYYPVFFNPVIRR